MSSDPVRHATLHWLRDKIEQGLGVEGSLYDALAEEQGDAILNYLKGGVQKELSL
jgi:hypothetical protein